MFRKFTIWMLIICMLMINVPVLAAEPKLTITGTGVEKEILISSSDWSKYSV